MVENVIARTIKRNTTSTTQRLKFLSRPLTKALDLQVKSEEKP